MTQPQQDEKTYPIWINHTEKIVSFKWAEGFEQILFSSQEQKLAFAVEKSFSGYRIQ